MLDYAQLYQDYYPLLFSIGYRMLGSVSDAEDVVQDVFLSVQQLDFQQIRNSKAYLCKLLTNRCINLLKSSRKKKEVYVGPWLPEPLVVDLDNQPLPLLERDETISYAFMVMMEKLTPIERAVFVLREAFQYEYDEIADSVEKSETNCRKIYSRVKQKMGKLEQTPTISVDRENQLIRKFVTAFTNGKIDDVMSLLTEDVIYLSDGGGKVRTAFRPIYSKHRVLALIRGITREGKGFSHVSSYFAMVNGALGAVVTKNDEVKAVFSFEFDKQTGLIKTIFSVVNPEKLMNFPVTK